mmetsp:Transcript_22633/g.34455  ORF Transcript_22633/g.34455 Transcript_22633/m.34455 type:complete len:250 (+) Transcript_22633:1010-1759(+)
MTKNRWRQPIRTTHRWSKPRWDSIKYNRRSLRGELLLQRTPKRRKQIHGPCWTLIPATSRSTGLYEQGKPINCLPGSIYRHLIASQEPARSECQRDVVWSRCQKFNLAWRYNLFEPFSKTRGILPIFPLMVLSLEMNLRTLQKQLRRKRPQNKDKQERRSWNPSIQMLFMKKIHMKMTMTTEEGALILEGKMTTMMIKRMTTMAWGMLVCLRWMRHLKAPQEGQILEIRLRNSVEPIFKRLQRAPMILR